MYYFSTKQKSDTLYVIAFYELKKVIFLIFEINKVSYWG